MIDPIYYFDLVQQSPQWLELKAGRLGSSQAHVLGVSGKHPTGLGQGAQTAAIKAAAVHAWGYEPSDSFQSEAMMHGNEYEPIARQRYEEETFSTVRECGYVELGEYFGYSPDGLVGEDGLLEIKCRQKAAFAAYKITRQIPKADFYQMQWGMMITGRTWCDYVNYHPQGGLIIERVDRDEKTTSILREKAQVWVDYVLELISNLSQNND